jgi:hypothetical protein
VGTGSGRIATSSTSETDGPAHGCGPDRMPPCPGGTSRPASRSFTKWQRVAIESSRWTRPQRQRRTRYFPPNARVRHCECQSRSECSEHAPSEHEGSFGQAGLRSKVHTGLFAAAACVVLISGGNHTSRPSGMHPVHSATVIPAGSPGHASRGSRRNLPDKPSNVSHETPGWLAHARAEGALQCFT